MRDCILVIGAMGQIGLELTQALQNQYGLNQVIASDIAPGPKNPEFEGIYEQLDVLDHHNLVRIIDKYNVNQIYLLAAILSAKGESNPLFAWKLNMDGLLNVLELAVSKKIAKIFWPSSIAIFGPSTPKKLTPQNTYADPNTAYGISKLAGEKWAEYYYLKKGVDIRSIRYPGLISWKTLPGGGTTDYAVDIYYKAITEQKYTCFLSAETYLPMLYMPDAIRATLELMNAPASNIKIRSSYNLAGLSFCPREIATSIQEHIHSFKIDYQPDFRQQIADSWPQSIDDMAAQQDWGWKHHYDLPSMTADMLTNLSPLLTQKNNQQT
ncbi:MAG: NAD-dependent epimerase/dehydratase family protein [Sphingobacteriales bacterium]|jgi:nucleoside-diphosphate-sugar epimerase|nr:NAD-dependent epimerase/dehydratase family protein [Sphingobacteriales bacterium]MBK7528253.1 NAD-dependent epimerase/dehydratase family protein [Sphingobacteriales bacterium]MBL0246013.1 NAD-dependent epimerase/dehydratase family protein [Sphingobacteriales bacterium]MDA0198576.1 NAD-dependent epimerase/dehydratase family protein [Bacteroidota bacterium]HMS51920.1 NAD-dependent epimerase/dehydratase family protein [Chitinophagales bacterium]